MKYSLFAALLAGAFLVSCGEKGPDAKEAYAGLVSAAQKGDGGKMYDYLDSGFRSQVDQMMDLQMRNKDRMPPEERAKIEQMNGLKGREAFSKMVTLNKEAMTSRFQGDYKILKADTIVVLTVQHQNQPADIMFMRNEGGTWRVTAPPSPPQPQMPPQHPPVQTPEGAPNGMPQGGAPNGAPNVAPQGGAPNGTPNGAPNGAPQGGAEGQSTPSPKK